MPEDKDLETIEKSALPSSDVRRRLARLAAAHDLRPVDPVAGRFQRPALRAARLEMRRRLPDGSEERLELGAAVGLGASPEAAETLCLAEAAERFSATYRGNEAAWRGPAEQAPAPTLSIAELACLSAEQARPLPGADKVQDWAEARSCHDDATLLLPCAQVYLRYRDAAEAPAWPADSGGCAAGDSLEDSTARGFLELVERDAVAIWWYNRLPRPGVAAAEIEALLGTEAADYLRRRSLACALLEVTGDLELPVYVALATSPAGACRGIGYGAAFDAAEAARKALWEMLQVLVSHEEIEAYAAAAETALPEPTRRMLRWFRAVTLASQPQLAADGTARLQQAAEPPPASARLERCLEICEGHGLTLLTVDLTRPDIGVPVARAVCPGLRSLRPGFGPGRLFDVPPAMGWRAQALPAAALNPLPADPLDLQPD